MTCVTVVLQPESRVGGKGKAAFNQVSEYILVPQSRDNGISCRNELHRWHNSLIQYT